LVTLWARGNQRSLKPLTLNNLPEDIRSAVRTNANIPKSILLDAAKMKSDFAMRKMIIENIYCERDLWQRTHVRLLSTRTKQAWWLKKDFLRSFGPTTVDHEACICINDYGKKFSIRVRRD